MTDSPTARLRELGLELPPAATPSFDYVPVTEHAGVLYVSGQLPKEDGEVRITGRLGDDVDLETAQRAARICVLQGLACAAEHAGGLDRIGRVLRVTGFVAGTPDFHGQPRVIDGASELIGQIFGDRGKHARSAVGVAALPRRSPVEIEFILTVTSGGTA
ncbi:RidA family protein [Jiangella alba]|uniref:Enamine deaminase RidA, house cleaning of reactive enamine intermediates, YjgF/YER057c/UK114 family n=1 Tax=Jiangella alba TaxID=561176 RepID=A0A1H5PPM2_9ACTN|nr:RidA family protein [Jiangella alba]SEF15853.1 Enamine deaminase RidA, house cleaning of reactive enamine intermediates, YjgF/YER057c/UK114 family [Jiangella alba]